MTCGPDQSPAQVLPYFSLHNTHFFPPKKGGKMCVRVMVRMLGPDHIYGANAGARPGRTPEIWSVPSRRPRSLRKRRAIHRGLLLVAAERPRWIAHLFLSARVSWGLTIFPDFSRVGRTPEIWSGPRRHGHSPYKTHRHFPSLFGREKVRLIGQKIR